MGEEKEGRKWEGKGRGIETGGGRSRKTNSNVRQGLRKFSSVARDS
jgi:hypothetical protein